jgi:hypothetical protein
MRALVRDHTNMSHGEHNKHNHNYRQDCRLLQWRLRVLNLMLH